MLAIVFWLLIVPSILAFTLGLLANTVRLKAREEGAIATSDDSATRAIVVAEPEATPQ